MRIVLLGDSIIDNASYVKKGEPDVTMQVQMLLPDADVVRLAVDGSVTQDVIDKQMGRVNGDDIVVLSSGGNDALMNIGVLDLSQSHTPQNLMHALWQVRETFRVTYKTLLGSLSSHKHVLVFTIYNPAFNAHGSEGEDQIAAEAGLSIFNDVIQQEALAAGFDVLELRTLFDKAEDYANPIEPSIIGGQKIAQALADWVLKIK